MVAIAKHNMNKQYEILELETIMKYDLHITDTTHVYNAGYMDDRNITRCHFEFHMDVASLNSSQ